MSVADWKKIKAIILDVDGVLTDGGLIFTPAGVSKTFNVRDGHWMKIAMRGGIKVGILTGRNDPVTRDRANALGLTFFEEAAKDKLEVFGKILKEQNLKPEECLYMGDDVVDYAVMKRVGVAVAVADAVPELNDVADWKTTQPGGRGAVEETIRRLLKEQGKLAELLERYLK